MTSFGKPRQERHPRDGGQGPREHRTATSRRRLGKPQALPISTRRVANRSPQTSIPTCRPARRIAGRINSPPTASRGDQVWVRLRVSSVSSAWSKSPPLDQLLPAMNAAVASLTSASCVFLFRTALGCDEFIHRLTAHRAAAYGDVRSSMVVVWASLDVSAHFIVRLLTFASPRPGRRGVRLVSARIDQNWFPGPSGPKSTCARLTSLGSITLKTPSVVNPAV